MNTYTENFEASVVKFEEHGFIVHRSTPTLLLIDLDDGRQLVESAFKLLVEFYGAKIERTYVSRNGAGSHVLITVDVPMTFMERAAYQAALGDDPKRVVLAVRNFLEKGVSEPFFLAEPK